MRKSLITNVTFEWLLFLIYWWKMLLHQTVDCKSSITNVTFKWFLSFMDNQNVMIQGLLTCKGIITDFTLEWFLFFHELKKCDIWRIVLLKSKHHKTNIWKAFSPYEQMQCGLKKYHCKFHIWMTSFFHEQEFVT